MATLDEHALDFLNPEERRLVIEMLRAVVAFPEIYSNGFCVEVKTDGTYQYFLGGGGVGPFRNNQRLSTNIRDALVHYGIAGPKINLQWPERFRSFTDAALDWYRQYGGPSPDDVRKLLGRHLRKQITTGVTPVIEVEEVATTLGVRPERVREQLRILMGAGLVQTGLIGDNMEFGTLVLTHPDGILWAEAGYPPIYNRTSTTVNVYLDLKVEVQTIIEQARSAEIPPEKLLEFEGLLRRVQEELEKPAGQGNFQRVAELLGFVSDSLALSTLVIPFLGEHWDKIQTFAEAVGSLPIL